MNKLEIGMYVRTNLGKIGKLKQVNPYYIKIEIKKRVCHILEVEDVIKASYDIIDLIGVGDVITTINLCGEVTKIDKENNKIYTTCYDGEYCHKEDIKSIVTKEQFESMSYRIGE